MEDLLPSDTLVIFAYAQAGLGHMRVADALYDGLPAGTRSVLLSSRDKRITSMHRVTSIHPILRSVMEFFQNDWPEEVFTHILRSFFSRGNGIPREELSQILNQESTVPKTILIVATHFGLAHQFAAIKDDFAKAHGVRVVLVVVVTDDSAQKIWVVPGADVVFCPSTTTKVALEAYHRRLAPESRTVYVASPYMIAPMFSDTLSPDQFKARQSMADPASSLRISFAVPISGAAAQLDFLLKVIKELCNRSERFHFAVVSKESMLTQPFLHTLSGWPKVATYVSMWDRRLLELYENVYKRTVIAAEITKPSEQAFKCLVSPRQLGGSILLFSDPIGRQERDNLAFFRRHDLIPYPEEQEFLWELAKTHTSPKQEILGKASHWRGMRLPQKPHEAAEFISWLLEVGIWKAMVNFSGFAEDPGLHSDGVVRFWEYMAEYLS